MNTTELIALLNELCPQSPDFSHGVKGERASK